MENSVKKKSIDERSAFPYLLSKRIFSRITTYKKEVNILEY